VSNIRKFFREFPLTISSTFRGIATIVVDVPLPARGSGRRKESPINVSKNSPESVSTIAADGAETADNAAESTVVAPVPAKINEAAISFSAYLRARGVEISATDAQNFWNLEGEWRTSPERIAEREARKAEKDAAEAKRKADREAKRVAALEAKREEILASARALGIIE
jgi:hypothetical protein